MDIKSNYKILNKGNGNKKYENRALQKSNILGILGFDHVRKQPPRASAKNTDTRNDRIKFNSKH